MEIAAGGCLSDETILSFAAGHMAPDERGVAHAHLDECETCQHLLNEAARALGNANTAEPSSRDYPAWSTMFQPGAIVAQRYSILRFIARGGMGEVYEALDRDLQERVALKTVTSSACDSPRAERRLKAEVQLARRVSHPNVCRIYDFGTHVLESAGAPIHFLTMQFVEGRTLGERLRLDGALSVEEAKKLAAELLRGLIAAHEAGVLHRDFKSDNVMLRTEAKGSGVTPVILDFGLARPLEGDVPGSGSSSSSPALVGTLGYIAPEQLEGKPFTPASDIYSFGVVWFEMLTGALPFGDGPSPVSRVLERLRRPAPAPSSINPVIPPAVDALVLRCLDRSPANRFQSASEALAALEAATLLTARPPPQQRRSAFLVAAGVALASSGVVAYVVDRIKDPRSFQQLVAGATPSTNAQLEFPRPTLSSGTSEARAPLPSTSESAPATQKPAPRRESFEGRPPPKPSAGRPPVLGSGNGASVPTRPEPVPRPRSDVPTPAPPTTAAAPPRPAETGAAPQPPPPASAPRKRVKGWVNPFER